eukprot:contig_10697_g2553
MKDACTDQYHKGRRVLSLLLAVIALIVAKIRSQLLLDAYGHAALKKMMGGLNPSHRAYFCEELAALHAAAVKPDCQWIKLFATDVKDPFCAAVKDPDSTLRTRTRVDKIGRRTLYVGVQSSLQGILDLLNDDSLSEESDLSSDDDVVHVVIPVAATAPSSR